MIIILGHFSLPPICSVTFCVYEYNIYDGRRGKKKKTGKEKNTYTVMLILFDIIAIVERCCLRLYYEARCTLLYYTSELHKL